MQQIEDALYENGGEFTPEIENALAETKESMMAKVDNYYAILGKFKATQTAAAEEIKNLQRIKKVAENAESRIKDHILEIMGTFGIERLESNLHKMYRRRSEKVETNDEQLLAGFQRKIEELKMILPDYVTVDVKINKTALKQFEKETGLLPAGAEKVENYTLTVK
jgi:uncharacterized protein (DUF885 family)